MPKARAAINHNVVSVRAEPANQAEQTSQAIFGETVLVHDHKGEYSEIETPDSYRGWCLTRHLSILETGERYPNPKRAAMVAPLFLPVFRGQSGRSERITLLTLGTVVELAEGDTTADLVPIRFPNGTSGFLEGGALIVPEYPELENLGPNLAVVARGMIGVPYLWGGRTPFGFDCSGFTQRVYWLCGVTIPRDAYLQAVWDGFGAVEKDDLRAGDLVFFAGDEDPRNIKITHVGLALADGRFIHASGKMGVAITELDDPPYDRQFQSARRISYGHSVQ
jgi:hypothetical protein